MKKVIIAVLFFTSIFVKAQNQAPFEAKPLTLATEFPKKGTYQIILKTGTDKIEIPNDIMFKVEKQRENNTISYFQFNENIKIKIYPLTTINAPDFKPFEEYVYE